jgi:hypothetical protein
MPFHSDEVWESFDALWRRIEQLSCEIRDLEARLATVEGGEAHPIKRDYEAKTDLSERLGGVISYEGEIHR